MEGQKHEIILMKDSVILKTYPSYHGLGQGESYIFHYEKQNNILSLSSLRTNKKEGLNISQDSKLEIITQFENAKIKYISDSELLLIGENRPYYSQQYIDEQFKDNPDKKPLIVTILDGKIEKRYSVNKRQILRELKKYKYSLVILEGKNAINKYGIEGLYGVIEINGTIKENKR